MKRFIEEHFEEYVSLIQTLTAIPAPSHKEEKRAAYICDYLKQLGYEQTYVDHAKNVICEIKGMDENEPVHIFAAHTDTVFPDEEPIKVTISDGCIHAPGVGDDTTNVCAILMTLKYLALYPQKPVRTTVFVLNACEEGLGNLKGTKAIMEKYAGRVTQFVSFDIGYLAATNWAVGSKRFEIVIKTQGGHSYGDFGVRNAIAAASDLIHDFYQIDASLMPGKTTYNVGLISGGTSVNTIAQEASFLFEYRSDREEGMAQMEEKMNQILSVHQNKKDLTLTVTVIGDRPSMGQVDQEKMQALEEKVAAIVKKNANVDIEFGSGSTDCNIPLSMGIPAICFGCYVGGGTHTRSEYVRIDSLDKGLACAIDMILSDMQA